MELEVRIKGQNYYGDGYRHKSRERDGNWRIKDNDKEKSGLYVPSGNRNANSRMEELLIKLVKSSESQNSFVKKINRWISGLS